MDAENVRLDLSEGDNCPESGCKGKLEIAQESCYCAATSFPPCSACTNSYLACNVCEWSNE